MELDKVRATADVYLFRINAFAIPAVKFVGVASVEDFFVAREDSGGHAGGLKGSRKASRSVHVQTDNANSINSDWAEYSHIKEVSWRRQPCAIDEAEGPVSGTAA